MFRGYINGNLNPNDDGSIKSYLQTNLGVILKNQQDENTISAIQDPVGFIAKRNKNINEMFADNGEVVQHFKKTMNDYTKAGLPEDMAREMAMRSANRLYQEKLELYELLNPGAYQKAFGIASLDHNTTLAKDALSNDEAINQYKARRRAKKAKRKAKREAKKTQ